MRGRRGSSYRWTAALLAGAAAAPAAACTVADPAGTDAGSYSPAAVRAGAVPVASVPGGIDCTGTILSIGGNNVLTGTLGSANGYLMSPVTAGAPVGFTVYLDSARTKPMSTTGATNFLSPAVIDLLGLLGNSPASIPLYVKVASTATAPAGVYSGEFTVAWVWKICSGGLWVGSSCTLGTLRQGSANATIRFTMTLAARPVTATISSVTTWDNVSGTASPRALPASKRRVSVTLTNPDIVPIDATSLVVDLPTAPRTAVALDGDGASGAVVQTTPGGSGLTLAYTAPDAIGDNVEFSANNGASFAYVPVAGDAASQNAVTTVRLRPQGSMAAGSTFVVSLPYSVR